MRRRAVIGSIAVAGAAAVAAVVVAPYAIAERGWEAAQAQIERAVGARLTADGPVQGRLWPSPRLIVAGLEATAPGDPAGAPLLYADHAKIDIGWAAFLSGRLESAKLRLRSVRVLSLPLHPPVDVDASFDPSMASLTATFEGGRARGTLRPEAGGLRLEDLDVSVGPFAAEGSGRLTFGPGTRLVLGLDRLRWSDAVLGRVDLAVSGERDGVLIERAALRRPDGGEVALFGLATTTGGDLRFLGGVDGNLAGAQKIEAAARLTAGLGRETQRVEIDDIDLRLGGSRVTGRARFDTGATPELAAELRADRLEAAAINTSLGAALAPLLAMPSSEMRLRVGELIWGETVAHGVVLDMARRDASIDLRELAIRDIGGAPLHAAGRFMRAGDGVVSSDALSFRYGRLEGKGRVEFDPAASPVRLKADVQTGPLMFDAVVPAPPPLPPEPMTRRAAAAARQAPAPARRGWSGERLPWPALPAIAAELRVAAPVLGWRGLKLDAAQFVGRLADGVLEVDQLSGSAYGGQVDIRGRVEGANNASPSFAATVQLTDVDLRALLSAYAGISEISGRLDGTAEFAGTGANPAELVAGLRGHLRVDGRDGAVSGFDLPAMSARLEQMQRPTDVFQVLRLGLGGGRTPFRSLSGTFRIDRGVARTDDLRLMAAAAEGRMRGTIDLPAWAVDLVNDFRLTNHRDLPPVTLKLNGPIEAPRRVFDIERLQSSLVRRGRPATR